jgi:DNA-binding SARP family transcriptional activator
LDSGEFHKIWIEQCKAARDIRTRFGLKAAFDYLVAEKLLDFANAGADRPEFARELPSFVSEVRRMFTQEELRIHIARIERAQREAAANAAEEEDELIRESPATVAEHARQFVMIKELLTASELGTS